MVNELQGHAIKTKDLALYFHIIQSEQITLSTDITDHIVEDHTIVQDHITVKPRIFTMRGLISEKFYEMPSKSEWNQWIENISNKLTPLKVLAPTVNSYFQSAINAYEAVENKIEQIYQWGQNTYKSFKTMNFKNVFMKKANMAYGRWSKDYLQQQIIETLDSIRINRIPVDIHTGWGDIYEGFYITDISVVQGDTYQQSELSVTLKELRFTTTKTTPFDKEKWDRLYIQAQDSKKTVTGSQSDTLKSRWLEDADAINNRNN